MDDEVLADDVALLKMAWHPAHFDNGVLSAAAFDRGDLIPEADKETGEPRYISVDEKSIVDQKAVDERIRNQGVKDPAMRKEARFAEYLCCVIHGMQDEAGEYPLQVRPERLRENNAHCGIHNVSKAERSNRQRRDYVDELRSLLIARGVYTTLTYDEVFPE